MALNAFTLLQSYCHHPSSTFSLISTETLNLMNRTSLFSLTPASYLYDFNYSWLPYICEIRVSY
jgi:hypothetical protein